MTDFTMEEKLSSRITMSEASFATKEKQIKIISIRMIKQSKNLKSKEEKDELSSRMFNKVMQTRHQIDYSTLPK
jgi:hypothetical protein